MADIVAPDPPEVVREPITVDQHRTPLWKSAIRAVKKELKWGQFLFHIHRGNRRSFTHPQVSHPILLFAHVHEKSFVFHPSEDSFPILFQWSVFSFRWYLVWKVLIAVYFVIWLGLSIAHFVRQYSELSTRVKWLVYLTNWTYLIFLLYLIVTAINVVRELVVKRQSTYRSYITVRPGSHMSFQEESTGGEPGISRYSGSYGTWERRLPSSFVLFSGRFWFQPIGNRHILRRPSTYTS